MLAVLLASDLLASCASDTTRQPVSAAGAGKSATVAAPRPQPQSEPARPRPHFPVPLTRIQPSDPIALLVPVSGRLAGFGAAIRDGFMAALYESRAQGLAVPTVRVYDTNGNPNFIETYRRAIADGARAVVGPLEKAQVAALYQQALPVPTLALNRIEQLKTPPANLYQFGLAPEDEALSVAQHGQQAGYRRAMIVTPASDQNASELQAFIQQWQQQGGSISTTAVFSNPQGLSQAVKTALNIPQSDMRRRDIEGLLGKKVEFAPHRRDDIDMILIMAKPQQARSIVPTLAFHYAGDVPTFALSRSYTGIPAPQIDDDIEGLYFTEMPWMLDTQQPLRQQILANFAGSQSFLRLYALGIDSFRILPNLRELETQPGTQINGQTGKLSLTAQRVVQRELSFAQIKNGIARSLDTPTSNAVPASLQNPNGTDGPIDATLTPQQ